ncbi:MAG: SOS response-associated peptidase, partial [Nitrospirae bacterium]
MCGRYSLKTPADRLAEHFRLPRAPSVVPRFNIAPSQPIAIVRAHAPQGNREWVLVRWGLIPSWAKEPGIGTKMINARAETAAEKPAFREALARSRCLVPADGYYEWQREGRMGQRKQPYYIRLRDGRPFAFAGLWERWAGPDGTLVDSCAILTTEPNASLKSIHDRMPVILAPPDYDQWLDPAVRQAQLLQPLLRPYPPEDMTACAISFRVNDPAHDDAACI